MARFRICRIQNPVQTNTNRYNTTVYDGAIGDITSPAKTGLVGKHLNSLTRNTLDCDQSNYSSRIVFSHIPIAFVQTGISAIRFADPENPNVEPNMKWIGRPLAEIWPFEISPIWAKSEVGRSSVGRWSLVGPQYILLTLFSYTPLRYVRNV